jgi:Lar family restriction alleviation protein
MSKLLPCPFCGNKDVEVKQGGAWDEGHTYYVLCDACDAEGPTSGVGNIKMKSVAIQKWNTRHQLAIEN